VEFSNQLNVQLETTSQVVMMCQGETIDLICHIRASNHLAMTNRQGPVSIYSMSGSASQGDSGVRGTGSFQLVSMLDEDHVRFITGVCEITKV